MQSHSQISAPEWTILKLLKWSTSYFQSHNIDSPRAAAEILLAHTLKLKRIDLYLRYDQPLCSNELAVFKSLIQRRLTKEPVAYIVGVKEFYSMDIGVTSDVLIPRPETEHLVEAAIALLPDNSGSDLNFEKKRILELGTGSGAAVLALASQRPEHIYFALDRSIKAVETAKRNARHHNLDSKIYFFACDWFAPLRDHIRLFQPFNLSTTRPFDHPTTRPLDHSTTRPFDMIISNPPYIQTLAISRLQPEIYKYEPVMALDGGEDGLCCLRHIIGNAHDYLKPGGSLLLEIGYDQKDEVRKIIDSSGNYEQVVFIKDYSGNYRVVQMKKKGTLVD